MCVCVRACARARAYLHDFNVILEILSFYSGTVCIPPLTPSRARACSHPLTRTHSLPLPLLPPPLSPSFFLPLLCVLYELQGGCYQQSSNRILSCLPSAFSPPADSLLPALPAPRLATALNKPSSSPQSSPRWIYPAGQGQAQGREWRRGSRRRRREGGFWIFKFFILKNVLCRVFIFKVTGPSPLRD